MKTLATLLLLLSMTVLPASANRQDPAPKKHTSNDPYKCKACAPALAKALGFLAKKGAGGDVHRQALMGFVYMATGRNGKELNRCVRRCHVAPGCL